MPTYAEQEVSRQDSEPVELYEFTLGASVFRYTSAMDDVAIAPNTFMREAISRTKLVQGSRQERETLNVTMPIDNSFALRYVRIPPGDRATFRLFRAQRSETPPFDTVVLLFTGRVLAVRFPKSGTIAEVAVRSLETVMNNTIPRFTFMGGCNNFLYDRFCGANPNLFTFSDAVSVVSGRDITVPGLSSSPFDFLAGYVRPSTQFDFRLVTAVAGDVLTLDVPFVNLGVGEIIQVFAGCDHLIAGDCALVFDRVADYGGFAFVPNKDIFRTGLD